MAGDTVAPSVQLARCQFSCKQRGFALVVEVVGDASMRNSCLGLQMGCWVIGAAELDDSSASGGRTFGSSLNRQLVLPTLADFNVIDFFELCDIHQRQQRPLNG